MATRIYRGRGKLHWSASEQSTAAIDYQLHEEVTADPVRWAGEFTFVENVQVHDSDRYTIELEDKRQGECYVKKLVNKVARGVPPHYVYRFTGTSPLE